MRIALTGDTHHGITSMARIQDLAKRVRASEPDVVVHLGDIGEVRQSMDLFREVLQALRPTVGVVGNHDLWRASEENPECYNSLDLWDRVLPRVFREERCHYLEQSNWVKDGVAIVGSYLHYDYSAQDSEGAGVAFIRRSFPEWTVNEYYERQKKRINNDGRFLSGLPADRDFAAALGETFRQRLSNAEGDDRVEHIVVVTHVPCMPSQITRRLHDVQWSLGTPYFGNLSHVEFIKSLSKVRCVVSGHSHQGHRDVVKSDDGHEVEVFNLDSDYGKPSHIVIEV